MVLRHVILDWEEEEEDERYSGRGRRELEHVQC